MYWTKEQLLQLLPQIYRQRDEEIRERDGLAEGPLASLVGVLASQITAVEEDIEQVYENWFVETCDPWVLPYLGKLLGIDRIPVTRGSSFSARAYFADMLHYRSRKGTPAMLERLARGTTGWPARVNEYFLLLAQTRHLDRLSGRAFGPDIRSLEPLEKLDNPFTETYRLPEVRNITGPSPQGRFNIPSVGIHLWPLTAYAPPDSTGESTNPVARFAVECRPETSPATEGDPVARWYLHPLGEPFPLFNRPLTRKESFDTSLPPLALPRHVPEPLRRLPLNEELESLRQALADGQPTPEASYLGDEQPVFQLFADDEMAPILNAEIRIVDFSRGWPQPAAFLPYTPTGGGTAIQLPIRVAIDPVLGKAAFAPGKEPSRLRAVYAYGFSADIGGGPYDRENEDRDISASSIDWQIGVSRLLAPVANEIVNSLSDALDLWHDQAPGTRGLICIMDSMRYEVDLTGAKGIRIPEGSELTILAADWPPTETDPGIFQRPLGRFSATRLRPHILGDLEVQGTAPANSVNPGALRFEGILLEGQFRVIPGHLGNLAVSHCCIPAGSSSSLEIETAEAGLNDHLFVQVQKSILGRIAFQGSAEELRIEDSIVGMPDEPELEAILVQAVPLVIERATVWGTVECYRIDASECLFLGTVTAQRTQVGCVRYSYLPPASRVPRAFRCQPAQAILDAGAENDAPRRAAIEARVRPSFESLKPMDPDYGRISQLAPEEIRFAGEDGREPGAFAHLDAPQRLRFLQDSLDEFLRAGLQAGIFINTTSRPINYGQPIS